ncbi:epoxide hydrolase, soluble (sEH) [Sorochytrium milnesiophthora]
MLTTHDDLIHDIAYDFHGTRLATCSSDQRLKVWAWQPMPAPPTPHAHAHAHHHQMQPADGAEAWQWTLQDAWKAHDSSVLRVAWAHPEYGNVLASCSLDRTVRVWEEQEGLHNSSAGDRWIERARLVDSTGAVLDIDFAPKHLGFKLASVASDGCVRIYEVMDVVDLARWTLMELKDEIDVDAAVNPAQTAAGGVGPNSSLSGGASMTAAANSAKDEFSDDRDYSSRYCLAWCPGPATLSTPLLAVAGSKDNSVKIFRSAQGKWSVMDTLPGHDGLVTCLSWAPNLGRSFLLIATGSRDGCVRIFKLWHTTDALSPTASGPDGAGSGDGAQRRASGSEHYQVHCVATLRDHGAPINRVSWNITGTVLASAGEDGKVRIWQQVPAQAGSARRLSWASGLMGDVGLGLGSTSVDMFEAELQWRCSDCVAIEPTRPGMPPAAAAAGTAATPPAKVTASPSYFEAYDEPTLHSAAPPTHLRARHSFDGRPGLLIAGQPHNVPQRPGNAAAPMHFHFSGQPARTASQSTMTMAPYVVGSAGAAPQGYPYLTNDNIRRTTSLIAGGPNSATNGGNSH